MVIETVEYEYPETHTVVEYEYPELTAVCPMSGLPDFYTVRIVYEPERKLPELKSLKMYFVGFRNVGILHENLANRIMEDFRVAVEPRWVLIELFVNNRGGVYTTVRRFWSRDGDDMARIKEFARDL
ncbi:MAG: preQ(1) synthase [Euryarchaeota archaeon]|nr:preQ(1) synthase [Euryarchaeota archaeon]